jgi:CrcB protein
VTLLPEVMAAGALGAVARYLVDRVVAARRRDAIPTATLVINTTGALALGLLVGAVRSRGLGAGPETVLGTGFCGAYTTFSTFSVETVRLLTGGRARAALTYVAASTVLGLAAAAAGLALMAV